jgi:PAS domain S-box-containing protein
MSTRTPPATASVEALLLDQVGVAVVATDRHGTVTNWNRHAEVVFGWSGEEAVGRNILDLVLPAGELGASEDIVRAVAAGRPFAAEFSLRRKDGSVLLCRLSRSPILDEGGQMVGLVSMATDVTAEREAERRLAARTAVTRALADAETVEGAARRIIASVCENLGWAYGAMWRVDAASGVLRCMDVWHASGDEATGFMKTSMDMAFTSGVGLPGRVWASGKAHWIPDVLEDDNFPRAGAAAGEGLHAAVGFPIVMGDQVLGMLEFFSAEVREPDDALAQTMGVIGSQIGQFMERKEAERELQRSRDQLGAILEAVAEGITVQAPDGTLIYANQEAARITGFPSGQAVVEAPRADVLDRFEVFDEQGHPLALENLPGRLALLGEDSDETVIRFRQRDTGEERWSLLRASPIRDREGRVQFAVNVFHDITERKRAEETQRFLAEAGPLLSSVVTDYEETLSRVAELAVPRLADWCSIDLRQADGSIKTIKVAHVDPEKVRLAEELGRRFPPDPNAPTGVPNVLRTGRSEIYQDISDEVLEVATVDPEQAEMARSLQLRSAIIVPLMARGKVLGAITMVFAESGRTYRAEDLALAEDLAVRAGLAMHNAELYRERDHIARTLQRSLLPPELPPIPHVQVAARYRAAGEGNEVGGDFYDVFEVQEGTWVALIGDVCGKGPEAAAVTGLARYTVRATAAREATPSRVLRTLNDALLQQRTDQIFCTVAFLRIRPGRTSTRLTVCCAGHPLPIVARADGTLETSGQAGTLVGIFPDPELHDRVVDLAPGDAIVLFTDGVTEEHGAGEIFGRDRLSLAIQESAAGAAEDIADAIERAVLRFRPGPLRDDVAILVLKAVDG